MSVLVKRKRVPNHSLIRLLLISRFLELFDFANFPPKNTDHHRRKTRMKRSRKKVALEELEKENIESPQSNGFHEGNGHANGKEKEKSTNKKLKIEANGHDVQKAEEDSPDVEERFKTMRLRKIIKENHGAPMRQVAFNDTKDCNTNLLATIGDTQVRKCFIFT